MLRRHRLHALAAAAALAGATVAGSPRAQTGPAGPAQAEEGAARLQDLSSYSPYERETLQNGLRSAGREVEPDPEGKIIEGVDVITLDVIEPRDPIPTPLQPVANFFHVTTKPHFVRRELLFKVGDRYERRLAEESARNLRSLSQLSIVILMPVKGSAPDRVRMLLITKDLWSLRVPLEYRLTSSGALEYLESQITEINLLGTHHQASLNFNYNPNTVSFGGSLIVPRMWDTRMRFVADANVFFNYRTSEVEGSYGSVSYHKPLFSLATDWSYGTTMSWDVRTWRVYRASAVGEFDPDNPDSPCGRPAVAVEGEPTPAPGIPCQYRGDLQSGQVFFVRSFGSRIKHNFRLAATASRRIFRSFDLSAYDPELASQFLRRVPPLSDNLFGASLQYQTFDAHYVRLHDVERMGTQEDYQLGHNFIFRVSPAYAPLRASRSVIRLFAGASYTVPLGDGLVRGYVESQTDLQPADAATPLSDGSIDAGGRIVTPRISIAGERIGRLVFDARLLHRYANYLNAQSSLGGDGRLRGYPTGAFRDKDILAFNLEFRVRPFEILKTQLGGTVFYDAGDAFDGFQDLRMKQSAGVGLRLFLPQINRIVIRADWGFPLTPGYRYGDAYTVRLSDGTEQVRRIGGFPGELTVTFGQAFPVPVVPVSDATTQ